ncbi:unnamed protein product [Phytophthora fragariaefolia]|uniref:Unnamed protein product n=1 Tax=Phytophthora fragariaefolia TaxID=1490495 RepID=A0A9W6U5K2_9STRA|nr:unnamed protein product [Phytophthora fragariaefolia]
MSFPWLPRLTIHVVHKFDEATLHNIVAEFDELRREYDVSNKFRQTVKESDKPLATLDDRWTVGDAACKFPSLAEFCGGVVDFARTATVQNTTKSVDETFVAHHSSGMISVGKNKVITREQNQSPGSSGFTAGDLVLWLVFGFYDQQPMKCYVR